MRPAPKWTEFHRYPIVSGTALFAFGVTLASWVGVDVSRLFENSMIRHGEPWRLATSMFPHVGVLHLLFNTYWVWTFGTCIEEQYGHLKTAALVILLACGSGAFEYAFLDGGVGLSGVGYGFFGLLWILSTRDERFREVVDTKTIQLFVVWFFLCVGMTIAKLMPVANVAHGAGAVLGILIGFAITSSERRILITSTAAIVFFFGLWGATIGRPKVNFSGNGAYDECEHGYRALKANRNQEAVAWLSQAIDYRHVQAACWSDLGVAYERLNRTPEALAAYQNAASMGDDFAEYTLGGIYERGDGVKKDEQEALKWYRKAAEQGSPGALNNVAWAYATSSDPTLRNPEAALKFATQAVAADEGHPNPMFLDTLAEAQYANGHYRDAVKTEERALSLVPALEKGPYEKSLAKYRLAEVGTKQSMRPKQD